ncbi:MAG: endonuclease IV [Acetobacter sp. 46_36]|nr:MAG: endonuclease IV [Acetobacter sp. 46_36]
MLYLGCHLSSAAGFAAMGKTALKINANTFQFFLRNPRGGAAKDIKPADVSEFLALAKQNGFGKILAHAPYTLNPCSKDTSVREFAGEVFADDLKRMENLPGNLYNFHPGSHVGQGIAAAIPQIVEILDAVMPEARHTTVLLETMSGKGSEVGSRFEELAEIISRASSNAPERLGVCLDTCHVYSAGYDIVNRLDEVLEEFDRVIGLNRLHAIHLNDSMTEFASHKDRHERLGHGTIGKDALIRFINHSALKGIPVNLETPNEIPGYEEEIALLRQSYTQG